MNLPHLERQYATGMARRNIEKALVAAGKDLDYLQPADLDMLEDFHTLGRVATAELAELARIGARDNVLDAGGGIGGTARFLVGRYGCVVASVDLTEEYCETARWLNALVHLDDRISVSQGDVTDLPFAASSFEVVMSQHVQMNVPDKTRLYQEARRVLVPGGRLAIWDIAAGGPGHLDYPLPWADRPELSHLTSTEDLRAVIGAAGFAVVAWNDLSQPAAAFMETFLAAPPGPLGLDTFVDNFGEKVNNLTRALSGGRLRVIQGVAHATAGSET